MLGETLPLKWLFCIAPRQDLSLPWLLVNHRRRAQHSGYRQSWWTLSCLEWLPVMVLDYFTRSNTIFDDYGKCGEVNLLWQDGLGCGDDLRFGDLTKQLASQQNWRVLVKIKTNEGMHLNDHIVNDSIGHITEQNAHNRQTNILHKMLCKQTLLLSKWMIKVVWFKGIRSNSLTMSIYMMGVSGQVGNVHLGWKGWPWDEDFTEKNEDLGDGMWKM